MMHFETQYPILQHAIFLISPTPQSTPPVSKYLGDGSRRFRSENAEPILRAGKLKWVRAET
jgi:hypothetical protein